MVEKLTVHCTIIKIMLHYKFEKKNVVYFFLIGTTKLTNLKKIVFAKSIAAFNLIELK